MGGTDEKPTKRWYRNRRVLWPVAVAVLVLLGVAVASVLLNAKPDTFTLTGSVELTRTGAISDGAGGCKGFRGYSDIAPGRTITVYDSAGQVVGVGALNQGQLSGRECTFRFGIDNVRTGSSSYTVEINQRGRVTFGADEAQQGAVALRLG